MAVYLAGDYRVNIHQLAIFWRDQQARAFTSLHFTIGEKESPKTRAMKIVGIFEQFTNLQIYGAALDEIPLAIEQIKAAPFSGMETRLEINLYPDAPIAPRYGVVPIGFTILSPTEDIASLPKEQMQHPAWGLFEQEVFPYLCLPVGCKVSRQANPIKRLEIVTVDEDKRPQAGQPPVDNAIAATERKIAADDAQLKQLHRSGQDPTQRDLDKLKKHQLHLAWLNTLKTVERGFFDAALAKEQSPDFKIILPIKAVAARHIAQEIIMSESHSEQNIRSTDNDNDHLRLLPTLPEQSQLWADVPPAHFSDPSFWLHRELFKREFGLTERSYYRWIDALKSAGLERSLPSQQQKAIKLFYRHDVDKALSAANASFRKPGRPAATEQSAQHRQHSDSRVASQPISNPSATASLASPSAQTAPQPIPQLDPSLAARLDAFARDQQAILQQLALLNDKFERLAANSASTAPPAQDFMSRALDILANFANFNSVNSQMLEAIARLDKKLKTLPAALARKQTAKAAPTRTAKTAKPAIKKPKPKLKSKTTRAR